MLVFGFVVIYMGHFVASHWSEIHLAVSGAGVLVFALVALIGSVGQVALLAQVNYAKPVVDVVKKLEYINLHGFLFLKLMFLSVAVWWTYAVVGLYVFLGLDIYLHLDTVFVSSYLIGNALLLPPLLWFLNKLSPRNMHVKWVAVVVNALTASETQKALAFLREIEDFEHRD